MIERRIEKGEESGLPTSVLLSRYRSDTAAMEVRFALFKLSLLARAYNPNQPRVPAGNPDGGQWTDGGFHLLRPRNDPGRREEDEEQVAQGGRFNPVIRIGNYWLGATQAQQARLAVSQAQAIVAMGRAQRADPSWRPGQGVSASTVEGEIARNEALTREANAHLVRLGRREPEPIRSPEILTPGGRGIGEREPGAGREVRTVPLDQFRELLDQVTMGARPIETPQNYVGQWYRRFDGSVVGVRFSARNGVTIETIGSRLSPNQLQIKVHSK